MKYSYEKICQVWNDATGEHIDVGEDRDGLKLVEIRSYTSDGKLGAQITMTQEQAQMVVRAINEYIEFLKVEESREKKD